VPCGKFFGKILKNVMKSKKYKRYSKERKMKIAWGIYHKQIRRRRKK